MELIANFEVKEKGLTINMFTEPMHFDHLA